MAVKWVFFLGAHCTITPSLVATSRREREIFKKFGTHVILPEELNSSIKNVPPNSNFLPNRGNYSSSDFIIDMNSRISRNEEIEQVLFFDESLLGSTRRNVKSAQLYPSLRKTIRGIPQKFDNPWHTICFCMAPYHEFFENCYLDSPAVRAEINVVEFKKSVLRFERTWINVIEDISNRLPNISVKIWRSDTTPKLRQPIEKVVFNAAGGFMPREIEFGNDFINKARKNTVSIWTQEEIERSNSQFESDWYFISSGWNDYLIRD
jgi:hypothetical protein